MSFCEEASFCFEDFRSEFSLVIMLIRYFNIPMLCSSWLTYYFEMSPSMFLVYYYEVSCEKARAAELEVKVYSLAIDVMALGRELE
jgi:hypothetical protein